MKLHIAKLGKTYSISPDIHNAPTLTHEHLAEIAGNSGMKHPNSCPKCDSEDISRTSYMEANSFTLSCHSCNAEWVERFIEAGIEML